MAATGTCICKLCDCGKHRCGRPALPTVGMPMDSATEYKDRFPAHPLQYAGKKKPPPHVAGSHAPMSSMTENREQFTPKAVPERFKPAKREYHPNLAALEATTGYMADYQRWKDAPPRESSKKPEVYRPSGAFDGITTNKADYQPWAVAQRYRHPKQVYHANPAKLEADSSYKADFAPFQVKRPPPRPAEVFVPAPEDREFRTTMNQSFVGFTGPRPHRRVQAYVPPGTTFEGISTSQADYIPRPLEPRKSCKPAPSVPPELPFDGRTEYGAVFTPKSSVPPKRVPLAYVPPNTVFEGISTMKADYGSTAGAEGRRADFGPHPVYRPEPDDRSWVTETRDQHGVKDVPTCRAVCAKRALGGSKTELHRERDGHIYISAVAPPQQVKPGQRI
ncbi:hypothetical protein H9P43_006715 [Blastocladiella emersonii ATCC 22665]|nr:hypothetical protein H9P43_006715 [Blastocladiella emersonii ATCC 22665]